MANKNDNEQRMAALQAETKSLEKLIEIACEFFTALRTIEVTGIAIRPEPNGKYKVNIITEYTPKD